MLGEEKDKIKADLGAEEPLHSAAATAAAAAGASPAAGNGVAEYIKFNKMSQTLSEKV